MKMDFSSAGRIIFGNEKIRELPGILKNFGSRVLILRSRSALGIDEIVDSLHKKGLSCTEVAISGEPDIDVVNQTTSLARKNNCEVIVSIGGGSVIDTGKAVSALISNSGGIMDYLEVVGKGLPLSNPAVPFVAVPTTSGTGSEVTKNAVVSVPEKSVKVSMRSKDMLPDVALIDPVLTYSVPPDITALTGMDAFTQVLEPYVSNQANDFVDILCRDAIPRAAKYLPIAFHEGKNTEARENMAWVSLMGGLALANAKLGAVHGFAGPLGGMYHQAHGRICASLLPAVMKKNIELLGEKEEGEAYIKRYKDIAIWITGNPQAMPEDIVEYLESLKRELKIPSLADIGIRKDDYPKIVEKAQKSSSMKGNPIRLSPEEMIDILNLAF